MIFSLTSAALLAPRLLGCLDGFEELCLVPIPRERLEEDLPDARMQQAEGLVLSDRSLDELLNNKCR